LTDRMNDKFIVGLGQRANMSSRCQLRPTHPG
jgi:hypothetical protein